MDVYFKGEGGSPSTLYVATDTYANISATYASAAYSGYTFRVTDVGVNGSDWGVNSSGELFPLGLITLSSSMSSYARAPSGTIGTGASGNITLGTAAPRIYSEGVYLYLPSIATTPAITAGYYWCVMSSTTVGTLYVSKGGAAINFSVGSAYTGVTTQVSYPTITILGGVMGNYRRISFAGNYSVTNNANNKATYFNFGGATGLGAAGLASALAGVINYDIVNKGASVQICGSGLDRYAPSAAMGYTAINTASNVSVFPYLNTGSTATDWWCIDSLQCVLYPR